MTQEKINFICKKASEITKEIWDTEHMKCFGNLEVKMQEIVEKLITPTADNPVVCKIKMQPDNCYYRSITRECKGCKNNKNSIID